MAMEQELNFAVESVVEDVLQQQGTRLSDRDLASRKAEETSSRRYEAAGWLRKTVGVVGGKDLPAEPSEDEFRLGLRSGIILCNVLNKVQPGAVAKVVEGPSDSVIVPDGAALSVFQYFENVRNFLVAIEEMGLPSFEASDLEQGGKSARIVNCVLALKAFSERKQGGGSASFKFAGGPKLSAKAFVRKNSEPFMNSFSRTSSVNEQSIPGDISLDLSEAVSSRSLNVLVRQMLTDRKQEEIPFIVESMLSKIMEEFDRRLANQNEQMKAEREDVAACSEKSNAGNEDVSTCVVDDSISLAEEESTSSEKFLSRSESVAACPEKYLSRSESLADCPEKSLSRSSSGYMKKEEDPTMQIIQKNYKDRSEVEEKLRGQLMTLQMKQQMFTDQQHKDIQGLKQTLCTTKAQIQFLQTKYLEEFNSLGIHLNTLAHAASGYHKVLEENRRLYNQVQDLKGNIRVYCRVRPFLPGQPSHQNVVSHLDQGNITIMTPLKYGKEGRKSFTFNRVFGPTASQEEVFVDTQPLVRSVLDGYNVCIFAYGQTGSGKTYTMTGPKELTEEGMGVNFRALSDLFLLSKQRKETISYDIHVQMMEIYNEQVRDLLVTDGSIKKLEIRNSSQNGINVPDANLVPVSTTADVIYLMNLGHRNRAVSATALNDRSSRSHSCLTVHVQGREITSGTVLRGSMHLVDLAGSERVDKSEVVGDRLKEAQHINKSLSALGDVISSLAQKNAHVPYRNSKLTQLLQDSLGGQAKTLMFVHISPEPDAIGETVSTLKFAERVSTIELGAAKVNKDSADVKELKEQIASLKAALARKDGEVDSRPCSPDRQALKSSGSSSSLLSRQGSNRQPTEDIGSAENKSSSKPKRRSFDLQDLTNSPPWPPVSSPGSTGKEDDKESISGEWVDKVMVKRHDGVSQEEGMPAAWEVENREMPQTFYNGFIPDPSKIYPENPNEKFSVSRRESQEFEDSDELDAATSDSSEADLLYQCSAASKVVKPASGPNAPAQNGSAPKAKKPQAKPVKSSEPRSMIPSLIPNPTKKTNATTGPPHKGRPGAGADGRRRNAK